MVRPSLPSDGGATIVVDASVMINLCACGVGREILKALPMRLMIVREAVGEVTIDRRTGRADDQILAGFLSDGLVEEGHLNEAGEDIFAALVIGDAAETLDDGEAASIALALTRGLPVVIDESKANGLCVRRFPELLRLSSGDLFLHDAVAFRLGEAAQGQAVFNALQLARMRVQEHHLEAVATLLGTDRLHQCPSLPNRIRRQGTVGTALPSQP
jgi:predicted nucleic acid-binding protein